MDLKKIGLLVEDSKEVEIVKGEDRDLGLYFYDVTSLKPIDLTGLTVTLSVLDTDSSRISIATVDVAEAQGLLEITLPAAVTATLKTGKQYVQVETENVSNEVRVFFTEVVIDVKTPIVPLV